MKSILSNFHLGRFRTASLGTSYALSIALAAFTLTGVPAQADPVATQMWGTTDSSSSQNGAAASAEFHVRAGEAAGQENAARKGILFAGPTLNVIGSQSIVQVSGSNNVVSDITQSSENSGELSLTTVIE